MPQTWSVTYVCHVSAELGFCEREGVFREAKMSEGNGKEVASRVLGSFKKKKSNQGEHARDIQRREVQADPFSVWVTRTHAKRK